MRAERDPAGSFVDRLESVATRLRRHATAPPGPGLTEPDPPTGERWDWGQVWAHLAEFVPYWVSQMRLVAEASGPDPVPFGRTKSDPERIAAIERDRHRPPTELWSRLQGHLGQFRRFLDGLSAQGWQKRGIHSTLGEMDMPRIVDEFVVAHLEAHADQLDGLAAGRD